MVNMLKMQILFETIDDLFPPDLVTRELGLQAYDLLYQALADTRPEDVLVLDFENVRVMDSSFAGGSILKLLRQVVNGEFGEKYLVLTGTNESTEYNINSTIRGHGLKLGLLVVDTNGDQRLLGQIEPNLEETLALVSSKGALTARELADSPPGMAINTASNRLKKLFDLHLIQRIEETMETGRQHVYQAIRI